MSNWRGWTENLHDMLLVFVAFLSGINAVATGPSSTCTPCDTKQEGKPTLTITRDKNVLNRCVNLHKIGFKYSHRHCPILFKEKNLILLRVINRMGKKAVIVVSLVEKSAEKSNEEIEREIMKELSEEPARIPWTKKVEKVTVTEI